MKRTKSGLVVTVNANRCVCLAVAAWILLVVPGCSSTSVPTGTVDPHAAARQRAEMLDINQKLASAAVQSRVNNATVNEEYLIGPGDVLELSVFGVEELNTTVRVSSGGIITVPLLGALRVGGKTPGDVEDLVTERLSEDLLHDPSVSVFISEYKSQQISVTGAVNQPALHTLTRPRTVLELVSMSGGLSEKAGNQIYVRTTIDNEPRTLIIDLDRVLVDPGNGSLRVVLGGGDVVFVPEAGTVFVEGAVHKPGAYQLEANTGVIEAVAMAGGPKFEAREELVRIITVSESGGKEIVSVNLDEIRANDTPNVELRDGDIVLVPESGAKAGFAGFWRGFSGIFGVGYGLNGP